MEICSPFMLITDYNAPTPTPQENPLALINPNFPVTVFVLCITFL